MNRQAPTDMAAASIHTGLGDKGGRLPVLTQREWQILRMRALGQTLPAIAEELGIHEQTAKNHTTEIHRKTGASCLADALRAVGWLRVP